MSAACLLTVATLALGSTPGAEPSESAPPSATGQWRSAGFFGVLSGSLRDSKSYEALYLSAAAFAGAFFGGVTGYSLAGPGAGEKLWATVLGVPVGTLAFSFAGFQLLSHGPDNVALPYSLAFLAASSAALGIAIENRWSVSQGMLATSASALIGPAILFLGTLGAREISSNDVALMTGFTLGPVAPALLAVLLLRERGLPWSLYPVAFVPAAGLLAGALLSLLLEVPPDVTMYAFGAPALAVIAAAAIIAAVDHRQVGRDSGVRVRWPATILSAVWAVTFAVGLPFALQESSSAEPKADGGSTPGAAWLLLPGLIPGSREHEPPAPGAFALLYF